MSISLEPKVIQDVGEVPLVLYSDVRAPLASLSFLRRSLVMAELAMIAYNDEAEAQRAARAIGFPEAQLVDNDGSQAYRFRNEHDVVLACRGTQITEWNDIKADANAVMSVARHAGQCPQRLQPRGGRSVAGAGRIAARRIRSRSGSAGIRWAPRWRRSVPIAARVVDRAAIRRSCTRSARRASAASGTFAMRDVTHYRWVHNNDVVTRVPPVWMGYRHCGNEIYFDRYGRIRKLTGVRRSRDRWRGLMSGLLQWRLDMLTDHSIRQYAGHLVEAVDKENAALAGNRAAAVAGDLVVREENEAEGWRSM